MRTQDETDRINLFRRICFFVVSILQDETQLSRSRFDECIPQTNVLEPRHSLDPFKRRCHEHGEYRSTNHTFVNLIWNGLRQGSDKRDLGWDTAFQKIKCGTNIRFLSGMMILPMKAISSLFFKTQLIFSRELVIRVSSYKTDISFNMANFLFRSNERIYKMLNPERPF